MITNLPNCIKTSFYLHQKHMNQKTRPMTLKKENSNNKNNINSSIEECLKIIYLYYIKVFEDNINILL